MEKYNNKRMKTVFELLEDKVITNAEDVFIKNGENRYTWFDIEKASQIMAYDLYKLGVKEGSHVAICGTNSINWIFTFFAINKLNAIAVLINPSSTIKEIESLIKTADVEFFCHGNNKNGIIKKEFIDEIKKNKDINITNTYQISDDIDFRERFNEYGGIREMFKENKSIDKSMIFFLTSGSTGIPKVVMQNSSTIVTTAEIYARKDYIEGDDKHVLMVPLFHMLGLHGVLFHAAATKDGQIVIPTDLKIPTIIETIKNEKITSLVIVLTLMTALVTNISFKKEYLESVKSVTFGGALIPETQMKVFCELMPNCLFKNAYALSESTSGLILKFKKGMDYRLTKTIGVPLEGTKILIQNYINNAICDFGETGEILIKGMGVMKGYYKLPKEQQAIDENGWLHTGDLGYLGQDGYYYLNGRLKEIIIRGGENIMPIEIASVIEQNDCIKEVKIIGIPDDFMGEEIAACLIIKEGYIYNEQEIRSQMGKILSKHKIPKYFVIYDEFPRLSNGKTDVIKLKENTIKTVLANH